MAQSHWGIIANVPPELLSSRSWIVWRAEIQKARPTKVPYDPKSGLHAETDDPSTWGTLEEAQRALDVDHYSGLGYVRTGDYVFIDLDGCRDLQTGEITQPWAQKIVAALTGKAYFERSPSGRGVHAIARGVVPPGRRQWDAPNEDHTGFAFYDKSRYLTMTGGVLPESGTIVDVSQQLAELHAELFGIEDRNRRASANLTPVSSLDDLDLLRRARQARNGARFSSLWNGNWSGYPSQSEADLALCCMLAFWTGKDPTHMDALFQQSGLMRKKWEERKDYRERTIAEACQSTTETWDSGRDDAVVPTVMADARPNPPPVLDQHGNAQEPYGWNDTGNANRLADAWGRELLYCPERRSYYAWTGERWQFDEFLEVEKFAEKTIMAAFAEAGSIDGGTKRKAFCSFLNKSLSRNALASMIHLAKKKVRVISARELDCNPWLLNVLNGTLDLRTGQLRPHERDDLISRLIRLKYDPEARCPLFMSFINRLMGGGPGASGEAKERAESLVCYLQRLFGCAATGKPEKILAVLYGQRGNNGKTTLLTTISKALGDGEYATQINIDSLMMDPKGMGSNNAVNSDLADLQGARFVFTTEVDKAQRLSLGRVKYLTGLTAIKTRRMRENWISFPATHKIFMDCNDRPVISSPTDAVWNRVVCVPFDVVIPDHEIDPDLPNKLEAELPGILTWIGKGSLNYHREGLRGYPTDVQVSTADYRLSSDRLKEFMEDCCHLNQFAWVSSERLVSAYESWCKKNGEKYPLEGREFTDQIRGKGCSPKLREINGKSTRGWVGIDLRGDESR